MNPSAPDEPLSGFRVRIDVPIRWGDMDAFQHVNNVRYFQFFESARIAYFERMGILPSGAGTPSGVGPILAEASCRFRLPVQYPDTLTVGAQVTELGADRFVMRYEAWSLARRRRAASGEGLVVTFDYDTQTKAPVPASWREAIASIEGGLP